MNARLLEFLVDNACVQDISDCTCPCGEDGEREDCINHWTAILETPSEEYIIAEIEGRIVKQLQSYYEALLDEIRQGKGLDR